MIYTVVELQVNNGVPSTVAYAFTDEGEAKARYYTILSVACKSALEVHGAYLLETDGSYTFEIFDRR